MRDTTAPRCSSLRTIPSAWWAGRVTSTRWPKSGRDSNHASRRPLGHRLADEDEPRRFEPRVAAGLLQVGEARVDRPLFAPRRPLDDRRGRVRGLAVLEQLGDDHRQPGDAHVDRQRAGEGGERLPVEPVAGLVRQLVAR